MSDVYGFRGGPSFSAARREDLFASAMERPMSLGSTFFDQTVGGAVSSYGIGTAYRDAVTPQGNTSELSNMERAGRAAGQLMNPLGAIAGNVKRLMGEAQPPMTEEAYKASPYYRESVPWDASMTEDRAAALATQWDTKAVRDFYAEKRPITSFFGNLAGQAVDPINYIPITGPAVRAAAIARMGTVKGIAANAALDASLNTAIAGMATRETRRGFGDDVSWQAMVTEIATAALIGGAFGTVGGVLERRAGSRAATVRQETEQRLQTLRTVQESRVALNEAIGGLANDGEIRLSPNATEPMTRIQQEIIRSVGEVDRSWAGRADTGGQSVVTPTGLRVAVRSEVIDALELQKATGDLQPRDRSRAASDAQIAEMAANLDPARLMFSPEADRGAPIVGPDGIVESGNGRVAALVRAAQTNPERFEAYKQALRDAGHTVPDKGIPILVSRRVDELTPGQRTQFVNDANTSAIARMSATETAMMDVRAMTGATLNNYVPGEINSAGNRAFVGSFLKNLPSNERLALVDADGRLNADGARRIENALIAAAYGDNDVVARFAETPDDNVKSIMGAMSDAAGEWSAMRKEIAEGLIDADFDVTPNLTDALRFMSRAREKAMAEKRPVATVIKEELGQLDMLSGEIDPRTKAFVQAFYKNDQFTQANGRDIIADHLQNIVRAARDLGKPSLFGDAIAVSPQEMIANARPQARQADIFGAGGAGESSGTNRQGQEVASLLGDSKAGAPSSGREFRADVATTMAKRFVDAGRSPAEAEAAAKLIDDFYATTAARSGVSVDRLVDEVGLPEVRGPGTARVEDDAMFQDMFATETVDTIDGPREQLVIPGAERISDKTLAERAMQGRMKSGKGQRDSSGLPLFGDERNQMTLFQPAWHGSPHLFDEFSLNAIGTGEGNQAYGWGLYFASKREVSEWYRNQLAGRPSIKIGGNAVDQADPLGKVDADGVPILLNELRPLMKWPAGATKADGSPLPANFFDKNDGWIAASLAHEIRNLQYGAGASGRKIDALVKERREELADSLESMTEDRDLADVYVHQAALEAVVAKGVDLAPAGRLFKVEVPDDAQLLDWDARLSEQTPEIRAALGTLGFEEVKPPKIADPEVGLIVRQALKQADGDPNQIALIVDNDNALYSRADRLMKRAGNAAADEGPGDWIATEAMAHIDALRFNAKLTGKEIYRQLSIRKSGVNGERSMAEVSAGDKAASEAMRAAGIPGHKYVGHESDSTNFVVYDDSRVKVLDFEQKGKRGSIQFGDSGKTVISLFENADASTALHETGHYFLGMFKGMAEKDNAPSGMKDDWQTVKNWWTANADDVAKDSPMDGITGDDVRAVLASGTTGDRVKDLAIDVGLHDQWARAFESYLRDGIAPTDRLKGVFQQFKEWLTKVYRDARDLNVKMSPELRGVFDRMLGGEPQPQRGVDASPARPDPIPEGRIEAESRTAKPDDYKALASQYRVDPETGKFDEEAELRQLETEGRLTEEDAADMEAADETYQDSAAYGEALKTAVGCLL